MVLFDWNSSKYTTLSHLKNRSSTSLGFHLYGTQHSCFWIIFFLRHFKIVCWVTTYDHVYSFWLCHKSSSSNVFSSAKTLFPPLLYYSPLFSIMLVAIPAIRPYEGKPEALKHSREVLVSVDKYLIIMSIWLNN